MELAARPIMHRGNLFRSVTEFRWAHFFETLGIIYLYESRTFTTSEWSYLPDFYLPNLQTWIEVKGQFPTEEEIAKGRAVHLETGEPVLILSGNPSAESFHEGLLPNGFGLHVISHHFDDYMISFAPTEVYLFLKDLPSSAGNRICSILLLGLVQSKYAGVHPSKSIQEITDQFLRSLDAKYRYQAQRELNRAKEVSMPADNEVAIRQLINTAWQANIPHDFFQKLIHKVTKHPE